MRCPNCEREMPDGERFCPHCGVPVSEVERCPHCGAALLPGERFCGECGREVKVVDLQAGAGRLTVPKTRSPWLWVGIAVGTLALLACIGACVVFVLLPGAPTPTATATSTPEPTVTPTPSLQLGAVLYQEDFRAPGAEWEISDAEDIEYRIDAEAYSIEVRKANWMAWEDTDGDYGDFVLEFDATLVEGDAYNAYGCLFRYQGQNNHYELDINGNGSFAIGKDVDNEWSQLVEWIPSTAIKPRGETNHIRLVAQGDTFMVYINDQWVHTFSDTTFASGDVAFVVTAYDDPPGRATFDNVVVWEIAAP